MPPAATSGPAACRAAPAISRVDVRRPAGDVAADAACRASPPARAAGPAARAARARAAVHGGRLVERVQRGDAVGGRAGRRAHPSARACGGDEVGAARPLRIPLVGLEVVGRLGAASRAARPGLAAARGRRPGATAAARGRAWSTATRQPPPASPTTLASGTRASVRNTSLNEACPFIWRSGRTSTPGWLHRDGEVRDAAVLGDVPVGAGQQHAVGGLVRAPVFHTFWPLTTHSSPSRSARVVSPARSEPLPGSENSWHHVCSPVTIGRSRRPFTRRSRAPGSWARRASCRAGGGADRADPAELRVDHARPGRRADPGRTIDRPRRAAPAGVGQQLAPLEQRASGSQLASSHARTSSRTASASVSSTMAAASRAGQLRDPVRRCAGRARCQQRTEDERARAPQHERRLRADVGHQHGRGERGRSGTCRSAPACGRPRPGPSDRRACGSAGGCAGW